jgi:hypothetical protein
MTINTKFQIKICADIKTDYFIRITPSSNILW